MDYSHVIGIAETRFKSNSVKTVPNYKNFSLDPQDCKGGVALYVRNDIESVEFSFPFLFTSEQIWCQINIGADKILVGCIY